MILFENLDSPDSPYLPNLRKKTLWCIKSIKYMEPCKIAENREIGDKLI